MKTNVVFIQIISILLNLCNSCASSLFLSSENLKDHGGMRHLQSQVNFTTLHKGEFNEIGISYNENPVAQVFRNEFCFCRFWKVYNKGTDCPSVNFENEMAIVLYRGMQGSSGYEASVTSIEETESSITVYGETVDPPFNAVVLTVSTYPIHVVSIPKSNKTVEFVVENVRALMGFPTFMVSLEDNTDSSGVITAIQNLNGFDSLNSLFNGTIFLIDFDEDLVTALEAKDSLLEIDGIENLEPELVDEEIDYDENDFEDVESWDTFVCSVGDCPVMRLVSSWLRGLLG